MTPLPTSEVICPHCGARNRVGVHTAQQSPICGRCSAALRQKPNADSTAPSRPSARLWLIIAFFAAAAAGIAGIATSEPQKAPVTCAVVQPPSGRYARYDRSPLVAPLTIRTGAGSNYFVKVEEVGTRRTVMTLFIVGGEQVVEKMPTGLFRLKYAAGDKWCGDQQLFGASTTVSEADKLFHFDDEHTYTVELIRQRAGNLPVKTIDLKDF